MRQRRRARLHAARRSLVLVGLLGGQVAGCTGERNGDAGEGTEKAAAEPDYESMSFPYELEAAQKRAVGRYLASLDGWRLAVATDNSSELLGQVKREQPGYEPYFVEGDLTGDGQDDFALVLTNQSGTFRIIWFRSAGSAYGPPQPVANVPWLDQGGLFVRDGDLVAEEFQTDQAQRYRWDAETRRLRRLEGDGAPRS